MSDILETANQAEILETMERLSRAGYHEVDAPRCDLDPGEFRRVVEWSEAERRIRFTLEWEELERRGGLVASPSG
jgi:hypothetical protein